MREIVFDTETTGFEPGLDGGDRMVEIGCIEMIDRIETGRTYHCYFNPERSMPAAAEEVHGLSDAFLSDKPLFASKAEEILEFIGDANLVAHNAAFDFKFLNAELEWAGHAPVSMDRMVDTLAIARAKHSGAKLSLDALCTRYGIDRSQRVKHGALLDAELLTQVYIELTGGRQIGLGLDAEAAAPAVEAVNIISPSNKTVRPARPHHASAEERERHRAFLEKVDDPLWEKLEAHIAIRISG
ncbi:DNA polymerase III subunit epsilon [Alterisphingorhabdus coralli]|uniref:DNA polymerase III subunit epsilon n=1 Tax=Alterisphingorhabdus coralli TaxID=3071408 RepID=A0AA97F6V1_9SPHN|nr:DNA polymerase III subunit epsilon [Parasphingorhabdus sp. SCSIO 66989]WOE75459.1 DNA polymerase III subunit epsilon [Parasphingorhabdus sp. SCSIO 66989]